MNGVVVLDEKGWPWESIIFNIWSQQWPRMRRNFAFSTGSLGDRRQAGVPFDLQIAPLTSRRLWGPGQHLTVVLKNSSLVPPKPLPWLTFTFVDLRMGSGGPLRKFLFSYGSEVENPRHAFVRLVDCFTEITEGEANDSAGRLNHLATAFPEPTEALSLKRDQLATLTARVELAGLDSLWAATYFLLNTNEARAFNGVPFDFAPHARLLWQHKRADLLALLGDLQQNQRATDFLHALAAVLVPEDLPTLWYEQRTALARVLFHHPSLAADVAAWAMPESGQRNLWDGLRAVTIDPRIWTFTCGAMLQAQCAVAERETVALAGVSLADGLMKWLEAHDLQLPSPKWREALRAPLAKALKDGDLTPPLLALTSWTLSLEEARSVPGTRADVQALARQVPAGIPKPFLVPTLFWLATLGFQTSSKEGFALLARAFFPIYEIVASSNYPREAWELITPVLPKASPGFGWDRCRLLRQALRRWLRDNPSFADDMIRVAPGTESANLIKSIR